MQRSLTLAASTLALCLTLACGGGTRNPGNGLDGSTSLDGSMDGGATDGATTDGATTDGATTDGATTDAAVDGATTDGGGCGAEEVCDDGRDNDCNGEVDEGCACIPGEVASCFHGTVAARGVGACSDGTMTCMDGLEFGTWGPCTGDTLPGAEVCDPDGVDENCNGAANEGCDCTPGDPPVACGSTVGACSAGTQACVDGHLDECTGRAGPLAEVCNGVDDDCDGSTDQGISRACGSAVGECSVGVQTCVAGRFEACVGSIAPTAEICDGLDNNCDGEIDEGLTRACGSAVGACVAGSQSCVAGSWSSCGGETLPTLETCNDIDDDCDGSTDEGITRACGSSTGICTPGTQTCSAGSFGACTGGVGPGTEVCDGSLDENCNGTVDEGCRCTTGATRSCGTSTGACSAGMQTCDAMGSWAGCVGAIGPTPEVCNGIDDNCNGSVDEGGICPTSPPIVSCPADITAAVLSTVSLSGSGSDPDGGSVTFQWTVTGAPTGSSSRPSAATSASTNFYLDASGGYVLQLCVTDDEGERSCCVTNITSVPPGAIHVEAGWSTAYGDLDLHLLNVTRTAPDGWFTSDDCYFGNRTPDWGPVGVNANPTLDLDDTNGYGPENTTIDANPAAGTYSIGLHYFCSHSIGTGAAPGDGPTQATVRVFCDGALIATYPSLNFGETDDWRTIAEIDYPSCVGRSRSVSTNGSSILPASFTTARHCEVPCTTNADCPAMERCAAVVGGPGGRRNACVLSR